MINDRIEKELYLSVTETIASETQIQKTPELLSHVQFFAIPWTVAHQFPLSMGFSKEEYWDGFPFPSPGDLPNPGIETVSLTSPALALAGRFFTTSTTWEAPILLWGACIFSN